MNEQLMALLQMLFSGGGRGGQSGMGRSSPFGGGGGLQQLLGGLQGGSTGALRAPATAGMGLPWRPVPFGGGNPVAGLGIPGAGLGVGTSDTGPNQMGTVPGVSPMGGQMSGQLPSIVASLFGRDTGLGTPAGGMPMMGQF